METDIWFDIAAYIIKRVISHLIIKYINKNFN